MAPKAAEAALAGDFLETQILGPISDLHEEAWDWAQHSVLTGLRNDSEGCP